jgi:hypothetical protein
MPGTYVQKDTLLSAKQVFQCKNVDRCEVGHMDIVSNRRTVRGRIIGGVDLDVGTLSQRCL